LKLHYAILAVTLCAGCDFLLGIEDTAPAHDGGPSQAEGGRDASSGAGIRRAGARLRSRPYDWIEGGVADTDAGSAGMDGGAMRGVLVPSGGSTAPDPVDAMTSVSLDTGPPGEKDGGDDEDAGGRYPQCLTAELSADDEVALWLEAADGVVATEGQVVRWRDRSRQHHEAIPVGSSPYWPLLTSDAEGRPAVRFGMVDGKARRLQIADDESLWFGTAPFALIAVVRYRNETSSVDAPEQLDVGVIYMKTCDVCMNWIGVTLFANDSWPHYLVPPQPSTSSFLFQLGSVGTSTARSRQSFGFNDDRLHLVVARRVSVVLETRVDGEPHAMGYTSLPIDVSNPGVPVTIGANSRLDVQPLEGELYQLIAVKDALATNLDGIVECLRDRYGID